MLIQATTPRPLFNLAERPAHIFIHTLCKGGVSKGEVFFNATVDPEHGKREVKSLEPFRVYPIEGEEGFQALEYVLPFYELFLDRNKNLGLVRFCTSGFNVVVRSAFRSDFRTYSEHQVSFQILTPVTGGGIVRVVDTLIDFANPTFDPYAAKPDDGRYRDLTLMESFNRTHKLTNGAIDERRRARVAAAEAMLAKSLPGKDTPQLPEGSAPLLPAKLEED